MPRLRTRSLCPTATVFTLALLFPLLAAVQVQAQRPVQTPATAPARATARGPEQGPSRAPAPAQVPPAAPGFDPFEQSIEQLQQALQAGRVTSAQLVDAYLARIRAYDQQGPALNAIQALNPRARAEADALDAERARGTVRGPLHGIPVLVKDNYETIEMPTTAGSIALAAHHPKRDAFQVARLKAAGAIILGKTNMHELAAGVTSIGSSFGLVRNPYDLGRNPGGSSGGTGAAIAANFAAAGMGSDTCGSIRNPASENNLVGLRGTRGLSSRTGIVPLSSTQDIGGPIARSIADLALMLDATVGPDPADASTAASAGRIPASYRQAIRPDALTGARLGVLRAAFGTAPDDQEVAGLTQKALDALKAGGAELVDVSIPGLDDLLRDSSMIHHDFKTDLNAYLASAPDAPVKTLGDILDRGLVHQALEQNFRQRNASEGPATDAARRARVKREALRRAIEAVIDEHRLTAVVYPTLRRKPARHGEPQGGSNCNLSAVSGLPALGLPVAFTDDGLPVGMDLLGAAFDEARLLALGAGIEQRLALRRPPFSTPALVGGQRPAAVTAALILPVRIAADGPSTAAATTRRRADTTTSQASSGTDVSHTRGGPAPVARAASSTAGTALPGGHGIGLDLTYDPTTAHLSYTLRVPPALGDRLVAIWLHEGTPEKPGAARHQLWGADRATTGTLTLTSRDRADLRAGRLFARVYLAGVPGSAGDAVVSLPATP